MPRIVFDCGANNGDSCIHFTNDWNTYVFAFEPTPEMIEIIKSKTTGKLNYFLTEKAVSNFNGRATFHVSGQADWGCSSLYEFSEGLEHTWPGRTDFRVSHDIEVDVITLESFLDEHPEITRIDYFHCDTQGSDLNVLKGLGKYIDIVQEGVVEVSKVGYELYKEVDNSRNSMVKYLEDHGFQILSINPWGEEFNIQFKR